MGPLVVGANIVNDDARRRPSCVSKQATEERLPRVNTSMKSRPKEDGSVQYWGEDWIPRVWAP
jgi:hypothetical protein